MNKIIFLLFFSLFLSVDLCFSQVGINTNTPQTTLDINGTLSVRDIPNAGELKDNTLFGLYADQNGVVNKITAEPTTYSRYLGFQPMSPSHVFTLPTTLELGYITTITGIGIGACYGVPYTFTLTFKDLDLISGLVERKPTGDKPVASSVKLSYASSTVLQTKSLENLDNLTGCGEGGHVLSIVKGATSATLQVVFKDTPTYFPDAGTFSVSRVEKVRYK
ncbi:MAG: hypothetical protein RL662_1342 [Bacteroidota bacterium]|jgi:hypothetical protein